MSVTDQARGFGVTGLFGLLFAASGVMGAIRKALNNVWDVEDPRPIVQAKAIDLLLVVGVGTVIAASFAITLAARLTASLSSRLEDLLGPAGSLAPRLLLELGPLLPALIAFGAFTLVFSVVPACDTRFRDVWPGAAVAAIGFELAKTAFAFYLTNFANYGAVYASLAAIVAFLVFGFLTANIALFGAQVAVAWPHVRDGEPEDAQDAPLGERATAALKRLVVREPER